MGEKGGCGGKRGGDGGLVWRLWGLRQEKSLIHAMFYWNQETLARFSCHESVGSQSALPRSFLAAVFLGHQVSCLSAVVEDESPAVAERDLLGLPDGTLVVALGLCAGGVPFLVEPVQARVVIRNPFLDGLPGGLDLLDGLDIEGRRRRAGKMDDAFPEALEPEKEFDFLATEDGADGLHGAFAARAFERVATPNLEDEVAPEGAHVAGGLFGWGGDEEDLGGRRFFGGRLRLGWPDDAVRDGGGLAAGFVGVETVVADSLLALGREVEQSGCDEVGGFEDLEVTLGGVVPFGAVDDSLGGCIPGDLLEGEGMAEEIFCEALAAGGVVGGDGLFAAVVDIEAGVFPGEEIGEFGGADEFGVVECVEEAVAEECDGGSEIFGGHAVEVAVGCEESVCGEEVEVRVEDEIVAEGVEGGNGSDAALGEIESGAEGVLKGGGGGVEEESEKATTFAKDAAQDAGDGEDELAVGDLVADGGGDPVTGGADAALMAARAEVAALAGKGEEAFVSAIRALEAGESGGEVAAAEEGLDGGDGRGWEWAEGFAVVFLEVGEEVVPSVVDELPQGRGTGTSGLVDGRHDKCS